MPSSKSETWVQERIVAANAYIKERNLEAGIGELKTLLEASPDHELGNGMLASVYAELGMTERAEKYFTKTLAINPDNPLARIHLGLTQTQLGKKEEALETWCPLLADPKDYIAHFYSGVTYLELNNIDQARIMFTTSAERMPADHPLYARLQDFLENLPA